METLLRSQTMEVLIGPEHPVAVIGERINPSGRKKLAAALREDDWDYVAGLARTQVAAGADVVDINVGVPELDDVALLCAAVQAVSAAVDAPICLDSPNPAALAAALAVAAGKPLVNSVSGEEASLQAVLPLVKEHGAAVIGLCMDDDGISTDPEKRLAIAGKIIERAARIGVAAEDILIDPLVMSVGTDNGAAVSTLETIERIRKTFGVNIVMGASNVSFGLPDRHTLNQAFLVLAVRAGATSVISDPVNFAGLLRATELLLARDEYGLRYIAHYRAQQARAGAAAGPAAR